VSKKLFKSPVTDLRGHAPTEREEVTYDVSYTYNGGIVIDGEWYDGVEVPPPLLLPGYGIVGIGVGLQLNACPPQATGVLKPLHLISGSNYENEKD
jgi:hypothetical protein